MSEIGVTLNTRTCYAGHIWASPTYCKIPRCPFCADADRELLAKESHHKAATIAALKGQITKLRRRRG